MFGQRRKKARRGLDTSLTTKSESPIAAPPQLSAVLLDELRLVKGMRIDPILLSARLNRPGVAGAGEGDDDGRNTLAFDCRRLSKLGVLGLLLMLSESENPRERLRVSIMMGGEEGKVKMRRRKREGRWLVGVKEEEKKGQ